MEVLIPRHIDVHVLLDVGNTYNDEHAVLNKFEAFVRDNSWRIINGKITTTNQERIPEKDLNNYKEAEDTNGSDIPDNCERCEDADVQQGD